MTYELRTSTIDGEACSTCRRGIVRFDRYAEPWFECYSLMTDVEVIDNPDETVCDGWKPITKVQESTPSVAKNINDDAQ